MGLLPFLSGPQILGPGVPSLCLLTVGNFLLGVKTGSGSGVWGRGVSGPSGFGSSCDIIYCPYCGRCVPLERR